MMPSFRQEIITRRAPAVFAVRALTSLLVLALADDAAATNHILREDQVMAGNNGDPTVQYLVITVGGNDQKAWGPQGGETSSRAMLVFFNSNGVQTGTFFFPNNPPQGGLSVLIATTNFAAIPGTPIPDILMPPLIQPGHGKVVFRGNPANPFRFDVNLALSYGSFPANLTEGAGVPAPALPMTGKPASLTRVQNFGFGNGTSQNGDFALRSAVPINTRGQTFTFPVDGPEIDASVSSIDFGSRNIAAGASAGRTVTLTSRGSVNPLAISGIFLTGAQSNQFQITSGGGAVALAPGATRNVTLTFAPTAVGTRAAVLRVTSNDTNTPVMNMALTGLGIDPNAPDLSLSVTNIDFGIRNIALGAGASIGTILANVGTIGTLVISNLSLTGANTNDFRIFSDTGQTSLGPGASRALSLIFTPTSAGPKRATLRIVSNDPDPSLTLIPISAFAFDLNPCTAPNPTNSVAQDAATNAMIVCPGLEFSGTLPTVTAPDGQSSCASAGGDVWFRYVPAANGTLTVNLQGIGITPVLSAHSAVPGTIANELACQSASGSNATIAQVTLPVTAGSTVFLRAAVATLAAGGPFRLALAGPPCFEFDQNRNGTTDTCESDFGSAPAPYPTTLAQNGARHRAFTGVFLGARIDPNDDGVPSLGATSDKLDGPENDEDGVVFGLPLTVGQGSVATVTASTNGFLNAWIDFNADGDWADAGEQIATNVLLSAGASVLNLLVPANATVTNRTYARFRFSSTSGLGVTGPANDGEVEDYAVEILPVTVPPGALLVRFNEVLAGLNGDSTVQFVELEVNSDADKLWGPQGGEAAGRAMLAFFDETGAQIGRFVFRSNAPAGGNTVLIATRAFADLTGLQPDFVMPPELAAIGGRVAFMANPDNVRFAMNISLSYGGSRYFGLTGGAGPANANELPILGARSLTRVAAVSFGVNQNGAFALAAPTPRNAAGQTAPLTDTSLRDQGRALFTRETFRGNGRTCATCHIASQRDQFGLAPLTILDLPEDDPLFVFEKNINVMKLVVRSQPSDLRGPLTGTLGGGRVLGGSGDTFLIVGGTNLAGLVSDTNGNLGILQSITQGNLSGPTPGNGSSRGLEDHSLLEHGRGLILENIDGFKRSEVFRTSPHLLNLQLTAPYGLSGEFGTIDEFSDGAVVQHFPRTLARVSGVDFRHPTRAELAAMTDFMNAISQPAERTFDLDRFATTEAQKRGRAMFFNNEGKCSKCHSGPVLNFSDGSLFGSGSNVNANFNTGVANLLRNLADGLPSEPAGLTPGQSTRAFNTPSLIDVRLTAPFFHDSSVATLKDAVEFYDTEEFLQSPAGQLTGTILAANRPEKVADLVAFLESLVATPVDFTRSLAFGIRCPGTPIQGPLTATITNTGSLAISITNLFLNGTNAAEFAITADTGETTLAPGGTRRVTVAFNPASTGGKSATLEFAALETNALGRFEFGVALSGGNVDNIVTAAPGSFDFGPRDIDAPPSPEASILVTNDGTTALDLSGFTVTGATPQDFVVTADTSPLAPGEVRVIQVSFAPRSQGTKSASIRIPVLACNTTLINIPLTGAASSSVHHFGWDSLASTQYVGTAFAVRVTAQDRNNDPVAAFGGTVKLLSVVGTQTNTLLIAPTNSTPFLNGVWTGSITVQQPAASVRLLARDNQGHPGLSGAFLAPLRDDLSLTVTDSPDPVLGGQPLTYTFIVHNTGPTVATGVLLNDTLPGGLSFVSGDASQGMVTQNGGAVSWQLGTLSRGLTATGTVVALPLPGFASFTNVAVLTRIEPESNLANNLATNTTAIQPFGLLTVTPATNFLSAGFSSGPFTPASQTFVLSNAGTAALNWQALGGGCSPPAGLVGWWPFDGHASNAVGAEHGTIVGSLVFTNALAGQGLFFSGSDAGVRFPASAALNVGTNAGFTLEAWVNVPNAGRNQPLFEWNDTSVNVGVHVWLAQSGAGSIFANLIDTGNTSHSVLSPAGLLSANAWQHVALTYNKSNGLAVIYLNGVAVQQQNLGSFTPKTGLDLWVGRRATTGSLQSFQGTVDEPGVFNRELLAPEVQEIFLAGAAGKCRTRTVSCTPPAGVAGWWPLDNHTIDVAGTNAGALMDNPVFTNGLVGSALFFDGTGDGVRIPASPSLNVGTNNGFTLECWMNVPNLARRNPLIEWDDSGPTAGANIFAGANGPGTIFAQIVDVGGGEHNLSSPQNVFTANAWHHVAYTYNRISGMANIYVNGTNVASANSGIFTAKTTSELFLGRRNSAGFQESMLGMLDEPTVYGRELSAGEIQGIFASGSAGKCRNQSWFTQSQFSGTLVPGGETNLVITINSNANPLAIGTYSESVLLTNSSNGRGTAGRIVTLMVRNRRPTLGPLAPLVIAEDAGTNTVLLTGISAGGSETQFRTVTATSDNPSLLANPLAVSYASPAATGSVRFAPLPNAHGTAVVSVVVRDDGGTANGALDAVTNSFQVTVTPVNDPPVLAPIADQAFDEGTLILITNVVSDPDLPEDVHTFSLVAPSAGASIGAGDGVFRWLPGEDQGPGTNVITVVVRDSGVPPLSATNRFTLVVREVNTPPVLTVPPNRTVLPGVPVSFIVSAMDSDLPANMLTFSLGAGAPPGATFNGANGAFAWTPPGSPVPATNVFTFIVADNGVPVLSEQRNVTLVVAPPPVIASISNDGGMVTIQWSAVTGLRYRLQFKTNLQQPAWADLPGDVTAAGDTAERSDAADATGQRFYRVLVLP